MTKEERISLFNRELSYINDEKLRKFAEYLLENADDYFSPFLPRHQASITPHLRREREDL